MKHIALCALLLVQALGCTSAVTPHDPSVLVDDDLPDLPGYAYVEYPGLPFTFACPEDWDVEVEGSPGRNWYLTLTPPQPPNPTTDDCHPLWPQPRVEIVYPGEPSFYSQGPVCTGTLAPLSPYSGSMYEVSVRTHNSCGYSGFGDAAEACIVNGAHQVIVRISAPSHPDDSVLRAIVSTLRFSKPNRS